VIGMSVTRGRVVHAASTDPLAVSALRHIGPGAKGAIPSDQFPFRSDEIVGKPLPDSPRSGYPTLKKVPAAFRSIAAMLAGSVSVLTHRVPRSARRHVFARICR
jgi:hypothetical protein